MKTLFKTYLSSVHVFFAFMHVCAPHACLVPAEAGGGPWIPWNWSSRCLCVFVMRTGNGA